MTNNRAVKRVKMFTKIILITTQNYVSETVMIISFQNRQKENQNVNFIK